MAFQELTIDLKNYKEGGTVFKRTAVRGIVQNKGKYLIIHSKYGDYKFPGGGRKAGESLTDTLAREMQEETGYHVVRNSIEEAFLVHEKRKGSPEDLMDMESYYYFCEIEKEPGERNLDQYEEEYGYQIDWLSLEELIRLNESVDDEEHIPWLKRETMIMKTLLQMEV
ncbi:MAG: NUDIX domain-containing protein [bacterium]|nr:NUDIX domain-containing protein [bacterium]